MVFDPIEPKQREWLEQQARRANEWYERYGAPLERYVNSPGIQALMRYLNSAACQEHMRYLNSPAFQEHMRYADRILNSRDFQHLAEHIKTISEVAERRFGPERLALAERGALAHLQRSAGAFRAAAEHIRRGGPNKVLDEAIELATSPEARETLEDLDEEVLVVTAEAEIQAARTEERLDTDMEVWASELSKEQFVTRVHVMQLLEVLSAILMGAIALSSPLGSLQQLQNVVGGLLIFLQISEEDEDAER